MNEGWLKLHRKFLESPLWKYAVKTHQLGLIGYWLWLLMSVNYKENKWYDGASEVVIPAGSFITSISHMAALTGLSTQTIRTYLSHLEKMKMITRTSTNKWTQIWIVKWAMYQGREDATNKQDNKPLTNEQQTTNKRLTTTKEYKELKNNILPETPPEKENIEKLEIPPNKNTLYQSLIAYCREKQGISREYPNYVKQTTALKKIFSTGYSETEIKFVIEEMSKDNFWQGNPFDLMNVANQMHKYLNRTVIFNKKGGHHALN